MEHFLGPADSSERFGIRYVEARSASSRYEIFLHALGVGYETLVDLVPRQAMFALAMSLQAPERLRVRT